MALPVCCWCAVLFTSGKPERFEGRFEGKFDARPDGRLDGKP